MTTTDFGDMPPTAPPPPPPAGSSPPPGDQPPTRVLRRSRSDRVGAGVASGLGNYFEVDPVLFRVLFATSAFFGGAGILAYLIAWAAIPDDTTPHAPVDRWVAELRRRRVPFWIVAVGAAVLLWLVAFSWWAPGPFVPVVAVVVVLIVFLSRRDLHPRSTDPSAAPPTSGDTGTVNLTKDADAATTELPTSDASDATTTETTVGAPNWVGDTRSWIAETRRAGIARRRRAMPVRVTVTVALGATLIALGIADGVTGIWLQAYFWAILGITALGLMVGALLRRTPWSTVPLLLFAIVGAVAFAGSHASLHDGIGERQWQPVAAPAHDYKLAFGQGTLNLRHLSTQTQPRTVYVTMAAGQVRVLTSPTQNVKVVANVHAGNVVNGQIDDLYRRHDAGVGVSHTYNPPNSATGPLITVKVHVADGVVNVERR